MNSHFRQTKQRLLKHTSKIIDFLEELVLALVTMITDRNLLKSAIGKSEGQNRVTYIRIAQNVKMSAIMRSPRRLCVLLWTTLVIACSANPLAPPVDLGVERRQVGVVIPETFSTPATAATVSIPVAPAENSVLAKCVASMYCVPHHRQGCDSIHRLH
jgi:hypothetical protein